MYSNDPVSVVTQEWPPMFFDVTVRTLWGHGPGSTLRS